jgi:uncharacterized protein (TIGR01777 family)
MKVLVSGSTGLIGSALVDRLTRLGHEVVRLARGTSRLSATETAADESPVVRWDPIQGQLETTPLEGLEAVVHLAGEPVGVGRWTAAKRERILSSRVSGTRLLSTTLARLHHPPRVLVSASAVGYYGDRGETELDEDSPPGGGFLSQVCQQWEAATAEAAAAGIRVVLPRIGMVLSPRGGALAKMTPIFRWGLGGRLGSGRQFISWITLEEVVKAIAHLLENERIRGPVNLVSPQPVTNHAFTKALARALRRPALLPAPALLLRLVFGRMADEMLLASVRALPRRLLAAGHEFQDPILEHALRRLLAQ